VWLAFALIRAVHVWWDLVCTLLCGVQASAIFAGPGVVELLQDVLNFFGPELVQLWSLQAAGSITKPVNSVQDEAERVSWRTV
jgi:hypothetical protein